MLFLFAAILYSWAHAFGAVGATAVPAPSEPTSVVAASSAAPVVRTTDVVLASARRTMPDAVPAGGVLGESRALPEAHALAGTAGEVTTLAAPVEGVPAKAATLSACGAVGGRGVAGHVHPEACLSALAAATPRDLRRFASSLDPATETDVDFATLLSEHATPTAVHAWWASTPETRRVLLTTALPGVVGNLDGVDYTARNRANRVTLTETVAQLRRKTEQSGSAGLDSDSRRLTMLQQVQLALEPGSQGDDTARTLVSLDTVLPGRAAISVGDLDTADDVSVMVPGMLYTVTNQMTFWTDRAAALHSSQQFWSHTLATASSKPHTTAAVAWMGYRTPDLTTVLGLGYARAGAKHLEDTVEGLDAVRADDKPRLTVVAHSYGSVAASIALSSHTIHVDSLVVLGSPGSVVPKAADLAVTSGQVYAAAAALDPVSGSAYFGKDPGSLAFGSTLLSVGAGTDAYTQQHLTSSLTHNDYFVPGSRSMRNLALIGIGRGDLAGGRKPDPDQPTQLASPALALVRPQDVFRD